MENQHQKISGYRDLSQEEIDLMNEIKALAQKVEGYISMVGSHLRTQHAELVAKARDTQHSEGEDARKELARIEAAEPQRWAAMARTDLQTGFMKLVRAIAQPTTF